MQHYVMLTLAPERALRLLCDISLQSNAVLILRTGALAIGAMSGLRARAISALFCLRQGRSHQIVPQKESVRSRLGPNKAISLASAFYTRSNRATPNCTPCWYGRFSWSAFLLQQLTDKSLYELYCRSASDFSYLDGR
ncbi:MULTISPECIES: hypothetical protein [Nostocales]